MRAGARPDLVVVEPPALEQAPSVSEVLEDLLVQHLVAQAADEALDEGVLLGLAGRDVVPVETGAVGPRQDRARGELGAVVADDLVGAPRTTSSRSSSRATRCPRSTYRRPPRGTRG